jgi:hypothetical protein
MRLRAAPFSEERHDRVANAGTCMQAQASALGTVTRQLQQQQDENAELRIREEATLLVLSARTSV